MRWQRSLLIWWNGKILLSCLRVSDDDDDDDDDDEDDEDDDIDDGIINDWMLFHTDDFSPVPKLSRRNVKVWPIRLPPTIKSEDDKELMLTLTSLRSAQKRRLVLHSMDSSVVKFVMKAVRKPGVTRQAGSVPISWCAALL